MIYTLLYILSAWTVPTAHPYHVSKAFVAYQPEASALEISVQLFATDLEEALLQAGSEKLHLATEMEVEQADDILVDYLRQHFQLKVNDQSVEWKYLGRELEDDLEAIWIYMMVEQVDVPDRITVRSDLLMDAFADQKQVVHLIGPDNKKGYMVLQRNHIEETTTF